MYEIKNEAINIIGKMPDDSTLEDIIEELYFKVQVDEGLKQLDNGNFISHNEVKQRISKWIIK
jgi:predicted transcriptional regulator